MKKKLIVLLLLFIASTNNNYSQNYTSSPFMPGDKIERETYNYSNNTQDVLFNGTSYNYGSYVIFGGSDPTYVLRGEIITFYSLNLNFLPSDAYNIIIKIEAYRTSGYDLSEFVLVSNSVTSSDSSKVNGVLAGTHLFNVDSQSGTFHNISSSVQSGIQERKINFGVRRKEIKKGFVSVDVLVEWDAPSHITVKNIFQYGTIKVDNITENSPHVAAKNVGTSLSLGEIDQNYSGYSYIWNDTEAPNYKSVWKKWIGANSEIKSYDKNYSFAVNINDHNASYVAESRKLCNQSFTSNFVGISYKCTVTVNNSTYNAPTSDFGVVEQDTIKFSVPYYVNLNNIDYLLDKWNDGNTSSSRTVLPNTHYDYVANYIGRPSNSSRNLHFNTSDPEGSPVKVMWNQHPNTNVTKYEIWRKVGFNVTATAYKIATINRTSASTYTYTDYDIGLKRRGSKDDEVSYDVKSYYSTEGTLSGDDYCTIYGDLLPKENDEIVNKEAVEEIIEYEISNYPNPYNPTTTINYKIKEMGNVNITVYDALGREVSVLVNDFKQPGEYNVLFDGSNLSNGVYYYRMQSGNFLETKKMIMMK